MGVSVGVVLGRAGCPVDVSVGGCLDMCGLRVKVGGTSPGFGSWTV